jgi:hypothetical protein
MTTDMVDGMGTSSTQGVFQRCAEETFRVLRNDSEVVLTVLDPLLSRHALPYHPISFLLGPADTKINHRTGCEFKIKRPRLHRQQLIHPYRGRLVSAVRLSWTWAVVKRVKRRTGRLLLGVGGCAFRNTPFIYLLYHPLSCHYPCVFSTT